MQAAPVISIVDDDESSRRGVARLIRSMGFVVHAFPSASAFLASLHVAETACLISDVWMPGMSGIELHRHLQSMGHHIPTILITGFPNEADRAKAMGLGAVCYLSKPFEEEELVHCIDLALRSSAAH